MTSGMPSVSADEGRAMVSHQAAQSETKEVVWSKHSGTQGKMPILSTSATFQSNQLC